MYMNRFFFTLLLSFCLFACISCRNAKVQNAVHADSVSASEVEQAQSADEPAELAVFRAAYPDIDFSASYDEAFSDWLITMTVPGEVSASGTKKPDRVGQLYWQEGRLLPEEAISEKTLYWPHIYHYTESIPDPSAFSEEEIERIRAFSSPENRTDGAGTSPFFYDIVYDCASRVAVESHIVKHSFLGKRTNVHERLCAPLDRVQARIRALAAEDAEVQTFINTLVSADSYSWRAIGDSRKRSFHSMGIALDVLPKGWRRKNIYWAWRRDIDPDGWMLLPLERRWMPPLSVIQAFEAEGFIWGGKWIIWDNMHFEYHPELLQKVPF